MKLLFSAVFIELCSDLLEDLIPSSQYIDTGEGHTLGCSQSLAVSLWSVAHTGELTSVVHLSITDLKVRMDGWYTCDTLPISVEPALSVYCSISHQADECCCCTCLLALN